MSLISYSSAIYLYLLASAQKCLITRPNTTEVIVKRISVPHEVKKATINLITPFFKNLFHINYKILLNKLNKVGLQSQLKADLFNFI